MIAHHEAVEAIYRLMGGDEVRLRTPQAEQREVDRYVVAGLLWNALEKLFHLPQETAAHIWNTAPFTAK
jgi:hypothetical protein